METNKTQFVRKLKRICALLICATMLLGLFPYAFTMSVSALSGRGTSDNPYIVTNWDEFDQLMRLDYEGRTIYIEIGNDIEWRSTEGKYYCTAIPVTGNIVLDLKGHFVHKYHDATTIHGMHYDGIGYGELLRVMGTLVINDTVGGGVMQLNGEIVEEYIFNPTQYDSCEQVLIVEDGGNLTVNGGTYVAGETKEMYCAAAYVVESEGRNVNFLSSDYNGYAWRVDSGTALTANSGSNVIIRGGRFVGTGYEDLGCEYEGYDMNIDGKQAAIEIKKGADVKIYNGTFHGEAGANIVNDRGGNVEVWCAAFTVKSPRIIVGDRWNAALSSFRIEYDTSKSPGTVNIPASAFKKATGGVFHVGNSEFSYTPGANHGSFGFGPLFLPTPSLTSEFEDTTLNTAGKIEWAPYSSRVIRAYNPNLYYPDEAGMYKGQQNYYLESTAANWMSCGYKWRIKDTESNLSKSVHTYRDDFDLNWFCTGSNTVSSSQSAGFKFQNGHTYELTYCQFIRFPDGAVVYSTTYGVPEQIYTPRVSLPFVKVKSFTNTWDKTKGGPDNYELTLDVVDINGSMTNSMELRILEGVENSAYSRPVIGADGNNITFHADDSGELKVNFTDQNNMILKGGMNKLALRIVASNPLAGERFETEIPLEIYCPRWALTDRQRSNTSDDMYRLTTTVNCVGSENVTLRNANNYRGTKLSYWEFYPKEGGAKTPVGMANGIGSNVTVNSSNQGTYQYKAYADEAGTKLVYASNYIRIVKTDRYYISYNAGEGTGAKSETGVGAGESFTLPECPFTPPAGKKFKCWRVDYNRTYSAGSTMTVTQDVELTAIYTDINATAYFSAGEGSGYMAPQVLPNDTEYTLPECTFTPPAHYKFVYWKNEKGWYYSAGYNYKMDGSETFTAYWGPINNDCTITFDRNGGKTDMDSGKGTVGSKYTLPNCTCQPPTGMAFDCYEVVGGKGGLMPGDKIEVTGDMTVRVCWTTPKLLTTAACTISAPVAGEHPDMNPVSLEPDKYDVIVEEWLEYKSAALLLDTSTFKQNVDYQVTVIFAPKAGYTFSKTETAFQINGKETTGKGSTSLGFYRAAVMSAPDSEFTVMNAGATIDAPKIGQTPATVNVSVQSLNPEKYDVTVGYWTYVSDGNLITMRTNIDTFKAGYAYEPHLVFTPVDDYSVCSDTVYTLNSQLLTKDPYYDWCAGVKFAVGLPQSGSVYGGLTSPFAAEEPLTIALFRSGSDDAAYETSVPGNSMSYALNNIAPGDYTLTVIKDERTLFSKYIKVDGDVTCDIKIVLSTHTPGDINGDGAVNNKDLSRLFQYLSDWDVEVNEAALDINGDGSVNNKDLSRLFQYLSDWDVEIF
ncbi:MAG: dockerin type I repeat-containing protein [Clostridia bacterium]|nr:dockerin type I repeat-containing protein [Clostridia bacterium]